MSEVPDFLPLTPKMPLHEWLDRIAVLAGYDGRDDLIADTGTCCWLDYYNDGYSPGEAWSEECSE